MDKLNLILLLLIILPIWGIQADNTSKDSTSPAPFSINWIKGILRVSGEAEIEKKDTGNIAEWQYQARQKAEQKMIGNFMKSMYELRIDAYNFASDLLIRPQHQNAEIFSYIENIKNYSVKYTRDSVVIIAPVPFYGRRGLIPILYEAGKDPGNFPQYEQYVYSAPFTGLVVDARGLNRSAAVAPRIFDRDHRIVYCADYIEEDSFEKWGAVQYTEDPYYREYTQRVGEKPFRTVAVENPKLIPTDISISNHDARVLLHNEQTRYHLQQGKVIIIID